MITTKVSVVMPVFNGERFIAEAIESVLAQTLGEFELICVDDGSRDRSRSIIEGFAANDCRVKIVESGGTGCSGARNAGIEAAKGEYLAFIDQDDLYHPAMLKTLASAADSCRADIAEARYVKTPEDADVRTAFENVSGTGEVRCVSDPFAYFIAQHKAKSGGIVCPAWNRLFRRETLGSLRFPPGIQPGEDSSYSYQAFDAARSLATVDATLYAFRQNASSMSHTGFRSLSGRFIDGREALLRYWTASNSGRREEFLACATREMAWIVKASKKQGDEVAGRAVAQRLSALRREGLFLLRRLPLSKRIKTWRFLVQASKKGGGR